MVIDPRITVAIPIVGISDFLTLVESRLVESNLPAEVYLPKPFFNMVTRNTQDLDQKFKNKRILIINGEKDQLVKAKFNEPLINSLRQIHLGKEGYDWNYYLLPGVGHEWCPEMIDLSVEWCDRWMVKVDINGESKL
jgi:predicted esterase